MAYVNGNQKNVITCVVCVCPTRNETSCNTQTKCKYYTLVLLKHNYIGDDVSFVAKIIDAK